MSEQKQISVLYQKRAEVITYEFEEKMWNDNILGENTPEKLRNTVLFLLGINVMLRAVEEHYYLRHDVPGQPSQLSFKTSKSGDRCLFYQKDCVAKTHDSGLNDVRRERKEVWVFPNKTDKSCCPVRLVQKYLALCPKYYKKSNVYLKSLPSTRPSQWYCEQVVGQNTLGKTIANLMKDADIAGYFTNHSARRTGGH